MLEMAIRLRECKENIHFASIIIRVRGKKQKNYEGHYFISYGEFQMLHKKIICYLSIMLFAALCFAGETIVLQNGLNGYDGCFDSHIMSVGDGGQFPFQERDKNFHTEITLTTANCHS